jgi:putative oxidoreductase
MKRILGTRIMKADTETILLLMRIVAGAILIIAGWGKIQHPLSWMGEQAKYPGFLQALAAISEFCGGIAIIIGLLTRIAALGISCTMAVAVYESHFVFKAPFVNMQGGPAYNLPLFLLLIAFFLLINGAGRFSLDYVLFGSSERQINQKLD